MTTSGSKRARKPDGLPSGPKPRTPRSGGRRAYASALRDWSGLRFFRDRDSEMPNAEIETAWQLQSR
jgi:hypothetical protein